MCDIARQTESIPANPMLNLTQSLYRNLATNIFQHCAGAYIGMTGWAETIMEKAVRPERFIVLAAW